MRPVTHRPPPRAAAGEGAGAPGWGRALGADPDTAPHPLFLTPRPSGKSPRRAPAGSAAHPARGINNNVINRRPRARPARERAPP